MATTLKKLSKDICYCTKKQKDILLQECELFECGRWKKCMTKTNNDVNKDLQRRNKNSKKI